MATLVSLGKKLDRFACPTEFVSDPATGEDVGIVMPLVQGETLESLLDSRLTGSIPVRTKILLAFQIAGAVAGAHALRGPRLALGDVLKAGNVLIDDDQATFVDVPSASLFGYREPSGDVRDAVSRLTTPGYVPKEALENPGAIPCEASDRFALAVVLFELLFGKSPFEVKSCPASVGLEPDDAVRRGICPRFVQHREFDPPTYDQVDPPPEVEQLFRAAFLSSIRPSALEWARALEAWLEATRPPDRPARRRRKPRWLRRLDPVTVVLVSIVLLAYAAKYAWTMFASPEPTPPARSRPVGPPLFQELFQ
jgi:serine/threonine protein kinase